MDFDEQFNPDGTRRKHSHGTKRKIAGAIAGTLGAGVVAIGTARFRNLSRASRRLDASMSKLRNFENEFADGIFAFDSKKEAGFEHEHPHTRQGSNEFRVPKGGTNKRRSRIQAGIGAGIVAGAIGVKILKKTKRLGFSTSEIDNLFALHNPEEDRKRKKKMKRQGV